MHELDLIQNQMDRIALVMGRRIQKLYCALHELRRATETLLEVTPRDDAAIDRWMEAEGLAADTKGYVRSRELDRRLHEGDAPDDRFTYHWPAELEHHPELRHRFHALRHLVRHVAELRACLGDVEWIYYQDLTGSGAAMAFPYFDMETAIPPSFDWREYHAYRSVCPEQNPARGVRWTAPTIDYAGKGLITTVSVPVYVADELVGLWSIDVQYDSLHRHHTIETVAASQANFIVDRSGNVVVHPSLEHEIDGNKGAVCRKTLRDVGGGFAELNLEELRANQRGSLEVVDGAGAERMVVYQVIPEIDWLLFGTFLKRGMLEAVNDSIQRAFEHLKDVDLSYRIDLRVSGELQVVIDSYNEMAETLEQTLCAKERAQAEALEAERRLNTELETKVAERTQELEALNQELLGLATRDGLTQIANRRHFDEQIETEWKRLTREQSWLSLLLIDVDYFKSYNDLYGHPAGDECLVHVAELLREVACRPADLAARYGGEEFAILLPNTPAEGAKHVAVRLLAALRDRNLAHRGSEVAPHVTCSIGVACSVPTRAASWRSLIENADVALYEAKGRGRNQHVVAGPELQPPAPIQRPRPDSYLPPALALWHD